MFRTVMRRRTLEAVLRDGASSSSAVRASALRDAVDYEKDARTSVISLLERGLTDPSSEVRSAAALALSDLGGVESLPRLLVAVEDDDPHVRQMAICALGELGDPRARERMRRALCDARPEVRFQAVIAFSRIAPDEAFDAIRQALGDTDASIRYIAVRCAEERSVEAGEKVPESVAERLPQLLGDPNDAVRVAAAILLGRTGDTRASRILVQVISRAIATPEAEDEAAAVELVGELNVREALPHLERRAFGFLRLGLDKFAWQAMVALARMGHERARSRILRDLSSSSRDRRTLAVAAAGRARLAEALPLVLAMKGDERRAEPSAVDLALSLLSQAGLALGGAST